MSKPFPHGRGSSDPRAHTVPTSAGVWRNHDPQERNPWPPACRTMTTFLQPSYLPWPPEPLKHSGGQCRTGGWSSRGAGQGPLGLAPTPRTWLRLWLLAKPGVVRRGSQGSRPGSEGRAEASSLPAVRPWAPASQHAWQVCAVQRESGSVKFLGKMHTHKEVFL